jgi:hypothetical protein
MKLPNGANAIVEERKLLDYVLDPDHPKGCHHAALFRDLLGITAINWAEFRDAILAAVQTTEVVPGRPSAYGQKYEMRFKMTGPEGDKTVLAVWLIANDDPRPRLITCYVE